MKVKCIKQLPHYHIKQTINNKTVTASHLMLLLKQHRYHVTVCKTAISKHYTGCLPLQTCAFSKTQI